MDYTPYFRLIQTTLTHCNEFVKKFNKITHYGGNEVYINEITLKLNNIFLSNGFNINGDCDELRKINLLLMLNTDAKFKYDLSELQKICHLIQNFPQLSKCLFVNLMWQLKMDKYYYEALIYTPAWFITEFLDETIDSLRFSKSFDVIRQVKDFVEAIYTNICRIDYKVVKEEFNDRKLLLEKFLDAISSAVRHYNTPLTEESITKSKTKMKKYNGFSLDYLLSLILACFKMFERKPALKIDEKFDIYIISLDKEPEFDNYSTNKYSTAVYETLTQINVMLLNTLQNNLLNITLNDFMYWAEIDYEDNSAIDEELKRDTLQKSIGEQSYELIELIKSKRHYEHDVIHQLSTIYMKPQKIDDIARDETIGTVLEKIEKSKTSRIVWLEELLRRTETLYFNTECLQTIIDNIDIVNFDHLVKILNDHQNFDMSAEDEQQMNEIFIKGGSKLSIDENKEFIDQLIYKLGSDYCLSSDTRIVQDRVITNYLNKITEGAIEAHTMWKLILKNPELFYEKLLEDIESQSDVQISTILKIILQTMPVSIHYIKKIIINQMENAEINEHSSKYLLLSGIFKLQILERKEFVKDILMSNLSNFLSSSSSQKSTENLFTTLKTLKCLSSHLKITDLLPPLIILLAQILDKNRWDLMSYSTTKEEIVDLTISIIQELIKIILINGTKSDKEWIKSKIDNLKILTKFYFQKLSLEKGEAINRLDAFLNPDGFSNIPKNKITSFLCENLVRMTQKEIVKLMDNEILQNFYTAGLSLVCTIIKKTNQAGPHDCFRKCATDYAKILVELLIPSAKSKNQQESLLEEIINLIKNLPSNLYDDITILFLDSLRELKNCENFANLLSEIDECELKRILLE